MDEQKLIKGLKQKKIWAYEVLYDDYAPKLGSLVKSYLGTDDVEDVLQETFIKVFKNIKKFRGEAKLSTWLYRITINVCNDLISKRKKRNYFLVDFQEDEEKPSLDPPAPNDVFREVMDDLSFEELTGLMEKLSSEDKLLINLRDIENFSYDEIAKMMDKPVGTIKSKLHYARKRLKDLLTEAGYGK
ncbi:MAG: hypothetical protein PWQ77_977 [Kosmotogales bacterium]|nr:hypothetical protein [Kosmotogales bacterium]